MNMTGGWFQLLRLHVPTVALLALQFLKGWLNRVNAFPNL